MSDLVSPGVLPVVFGCGGPALTAAERRLFRTANPLGFALFRRNCVDPAQLRRLIAELREAVGRADVAVLVDQEGGRVQRLKPPHWPRDPAAARFGELATRDPEAAERAARLLAHAVATDLAAAGVTGDAWPVLDLTVPGASDVIGDRAFSAHPDTVIRLGRAVCRGLLDGGILPIIKHLPGHGRALVDSHKALPVIEAGLDELEAADFQPFRALADQPWGMTAHIVFPAIDPDTPATLSAIVIEQIIRGRIGFGGVLITDDLCMGALTGSPAERARRALAAGCDIALHCNGKLDEMAAIADGLPPLSAATSERLARGEAVRRAAVVPADPAALRAEVDGLLAAA